MDRMRVARWRQSLHSGYDHRTSYENNNNYIYGDKKKAGDHWSSSNDLWPITKWIFSYVVIALTSLVCYANNVDGDFVHDDVKAILGNPDVRRQDTILALFRNDFWGKPMSDRTSHKSYRPITVLSFRLNHVFGELNPKSYHITNNILHAVATLMFTHICRKVAFHDDVFTSSMAGLIFAVHPVHTEAVSGLVGRADILSCIFFLLSLLAYYNYSSLIRSSDRTAPSSGRRPSLLWTITSAMLALFSKEQGVTVLLLCIFNEAYSTWQQWPTSSNTTTKTTTSNSSRSSFTLHRNSISKLVLALILLCTYRIWMLGGTYPNFQEEDNPASFSPFFFVRVLTYIYLWAFNAWLMLCPVHLSHDWQMGSIPLVETLSDIRNVASCLLMVLLLLLTWKAFTCHKESDRFRVSFGLMLAVLPFLLASNIFITVGFVVAERVLYMPSMGVIVLVVSGLDVMRLSLPVYWRYLKPFALIILVLIPACRTLIRNKVWQDRQTLAKSGLQILPHNAKMHYNYGNLLADMGDIEGAVSHYKIAVSLWPSYASAHNNLGFYLSNKTEAMIHLNEAIKLSPCHANAHSNIANIYHNSLNKTKEAIKLLYYAEECEPSNPTPHLSLATIYEDLGDERLAERHYMMALTLAPSQASVHHHVALYYENRGEFETAIKHFEKAVSLNRPVSLKSLAKLYGNTGDTDKAEEYWIKVLSVNRDPLTLDMAASFYFKIGRVSESIDLYKEAYHLEPNNTGVVLHLAQALTNDEQYAEAERLIIKHLDDDPDNVELTVQLANVYGLNKSHNKAIHLIEEFLKRRSYVLSAKQLSVLYHQIGNHKKDSLEFDSAVENYHKAIQLDDTNADCHHNLAVYYHRKHLFDKARHHYESAYKLSPEDPLLQVNYDRFNQDLIVQGSGSDSTISNKRTENTTEK